jgi:tRNA modification GTPase
VADLTLVVADQSVAGGEASADELSQTIDNKHLIVLSKADLPGAWSRPGAISVSATTLQGLEDLRAAMLSALDVDALGDRPAITNVRHAELVRRARSALGRARAALLEDPPMSEEFVLADLQEARTTLEEVTGKRAPDDVLAHIFARFCVGK